MMDNKTLFELAMEAAERNEKFFDIVGPNGTIVGRITLTPALIEEAKKYIASVKRNKEIKKDREDAVQKEIDAVGDEVLPVESPVEIVGGLKGIIKKVTVGYHDRPYYRVFLQNGEGTYGDPTDENNYGFFYARNFRNYGRRV